MWRRQKGHSDEWVLPHKTKAPEVMICTTKQSWMEQLITSCRPKPMSCTTLIIKAGCMAETLLEDKKTLINKIRLFSCPNLLLRNTLLRSSTDILAILTLPLSPAIPPLPPSFLLYLTFAGQQAEASLSASSFPQVIQIHHWPIYNSRQNTQFYLSTDSLEVRQPASLPQVV